MSSSYSVINELYGVEPARRRPEPQGVLGLVVVIVLSGMFFYESVHPVMRLRSNPVPVFLKGTANLNSASARHQEHIARCWDSAAQYVSEKYSYGAILPSRPPEDFTIAVGGDYATSALYWQRVRRLWNQPDSWVTSYQLNTGWINNAMGSLGKAVKDYLNT